MIECRVLNEVITTRVLYASDYGMDILRHLRKVRVSLVFEIGLFLNDKVNLLPLLVHLDFGIVDGFHYATCKRIVCGRFLWNYAFEFLFNTTVNRNLMICNNAFDLVAVVVLKFEPVATFVPA